MSSHMKKVKLKKANTGMAVKSATPKPATFKPAEKTTNIYGKNPKTGKEEQMVMKAGKYAFSSMKKGGSAKAMPKAMYGKSMMQYGGPQESFASRKTKTVSVSPDKKYKTTVKQNMGPAGVSTKVTNRRTVKGVLSGAPKAGMMKKGGNTKKK